MPRASLRARARPGVRNGVNPPISDRANLDRANLDKANLGR